MLADRLGIKVRWIRPGIKEIVPAYFETLRAQDAPFHGATVVAQYLVYKDVATTGVRVLLGGQGGDESFMGYRKFQLFHLHKLLHRKRYDKALGFALSLLPAAIADRAQAGDYISAVRRANSRDRRDSVLDIPQTGYDVETVR